MIHYEIPEGAYYSIGTKKPALTKMVIGFEFSFILLPNAFYKPLSTDLQKIGGLTMDPLKQSIMRLAYRRMDYQNNVLPDGQAELHGYLSLNGKFVVAGRKLGIVSKNITYTGRAIWDQSTKEVAYTVDNIGPKPVIRKFPFAANPFSIFGIWGYHQYPYFEDRGKGAPQDMEYMVQIDPIYASNSLQISATKNLGNLAKGTLKLPIQFYAQSRSYLLGAYNRFKSLPV